MSGDTSSHSLALAQRQAVRGQEVPPFPPGHALTPECLPTGGPESYGESRGERCTWVHPWVPLWHGLGHGPAVCSAPYLRTLAKGTYLSLQAPFHSTRPQGFRTRIRTSVSPWYKIWMESGQRSRARGQGEFSSFTAPQGRVQWSDSRPAGRSPSRRVPSPASSGSWTPTRSRW